MTLLTGTIYVAALVSRFCSKVMSGDFNGLGLPWAGKVDTQKDRILP